MSEWKSIIKRTAAVLACVFAASAPAANAEIYFGGGTAEFRGDAFETDSKVIAAYNDDGSLAAVRLLTDADKNKYETAANGSYKLGIDDITAAAGGSAKIKVFAWNGDDLSPAEKAAEAETVVLDPRNIDVENQRYSQYDESISGVWSGNTDRIKTANAIANDLAPIIYNDGGEKKEYKLANGTDTDNTADIFVNGSSLGKTGGSDAGSAEIYKYIISNTPGRITLTDDTSDGYYDHISADYYESAIVDDVLDSGKIYTSSFQEGINMTSFKLMKDEYHDYKITLDGEEIQYTELQQGDVISGARDVTENSVDDSSYLDILVRRGTVNGFITEHDTEDFTYTLGGERYSYDSYLLPNGYIEDAPGMNAVLYVDVFDRVVNFEERKSYAILDDIYQNEDSVLYTAKLILPSSETAEFTIESENVADTAKTVLFKNGESGEKNDITNRVILYKTDIDGNMYTLSEQYAKTTSSEYSVYNANTKKIEGAHLSDDADILYAEEQGSISRLDALEHNRKYTAALFDKDINSRYHLVIVTEIGETEEPIQMDTLGQSAVFVKSKTVTNIDNEEQQQVTLLYNGTEVRYLVQNGIETGFNTGDVVAPEFDEKDVITKLDLVASMKVANGTKRAAYENREDIALNCPDKWSTQTNPDSDVELYYGLIVDKGQSYFELVEKYGTKRYDYDIADDTRVYVYDYSVPHSEALYVGNSASIVKTTIPHDAITYDDLINWDDFEKDYYAVWSSNYAFVRAEDGEAREVFVILGPGDENY